VVSKPGRSVAVTMEKWRRTQSGVERGLMQHPQVQHRLQQVISHLLPLAKQQGRECTAEQRSAGSTKTK